MAILMDVGMAMVMAMAMMVERVVIVMSMPRPV